MALVLLKYLSLQSERVVYQQFTSPVFLLQFKGVWAFFLPFLIISSTIRIEFISSRTLRYVCRLSTVVPSTFSGKSVGKRDEPKEIKTQKEKEEDLLYCELGV